MTANHQWHDARYTPEQQAYAWGEYDGYWGRPLLDGQYANRVWLAYLKGWTAGVKERAAEPSDEEIDAWMRSIADAIGDGER